MFYRFVCALLGFCAREFPEKLENQEPEEIIVECTSYMYNFVYVDLETILEKEYFPDTKTFVEN